MFLTLFWFGSFVSLGVGVHFEHIEATKCSSRFIWHQDIFKAMINSLERTPEKVLSITQYLHFRSYEQIVFNAVADYRVRITVHNRMIQNTDSSSFERYDAFSSHGLFFGKYGGPIYADLAGFSSSYGNPKNSYTEGFFIIEKLIKSNDFSEPKEDGVKLQRIHA